MKAKGRVLFLVLGVALALSAATAAAAQAAQGMSEGNVSVLVKGEQIGSTVFSLEGNNVTCETVRAETTGEVSSPASSLTVHQIYEKCTAFGFLNATVNTSACSMVETLGEEISADKFSGKVELKCEAGKSIVISAATCEVQIPGGQTFTTGLSGTNNTTATPKDVVLQFNVTTIKALKTKDGFLCPLGGTGEGTASFTGETTGRGFHEGKAVGVTFEP